MEYLIKKAEESDWRLIRDIYVSCTEWLSKQGWKHWERSSHLNSREKVIQRIRENDVYILFVDGKAVATITLGYEHPSYYKDYTFWEEPFVPAVYVSRLAVLPDYHRRGFGSRLLEFAEDKARQKGIFYVRFDALADYRELVDSYLRRGYKIVGKDFFVRTEGNFFEKRLNEIM